MSEQAADDNDQDGSGTIFYFTLESERSGGRDKKERRRYAESPYRQIEREKALQGEPLEAKPVGAEYYHAKKVADDALQKERDG